MSSTSETNSITAPEKGVIFWPVETGDSTTIFVDEEHVMQLDIHHQAKSEDEEEESHPVVDHLIELLPSIDNRPYLSTFALTHPDKDHVKGFSYLLEEALIGELWFSPRIFKEDDDELCDDAIAFKVEAERRIELVRKANGELNSGDRIRIVGYDGILEDKMFNGFPEEFISYPGNSIDELDGDDVSHSFTAFIHSPFKGDDGEERNDTSLGMQITLTESGTESKFLFFGDLKYDGVRKIIDISNDNENEDKLEWNVLLAPHHCSKSVMYTKNDNGDYVLQSELMDDLEAAALEPGYIVASSKPIPGRNSSGDNPPHARAKARYEEIVPNEFMCTHENPKDDTRPIVFSATSSGLLLGIEEGGSVAKTSKSISASIASARGENNPPNTTAGFGC